MDDLFFMRALTVISTCALNTYNIFLDIDRYIAVSIAIAGNWPSFSDE
jgi:hypothetical protein